MFKIFLIGFLCSQTFQRMNERERWRGERDRKRVRQKRYRLRINWRLSPYSRTALKCFGDIVSPCHTPRLIFILFLLVYCCSNVVWYISSFRVWIQFYGIKCLFEFYKKSMPLGVCCIRMSFFYEDFQA